MSLPRLISSLTKTYQYSELATIMSVSENTIRRWEKGLNKPHVMLIAKLNELSAANRQKTDRNISASQ